MVFLDQIKSSDAGLFKITDLQGFTVSTVHLGLKGKPGIEQTETRLVPQVMTFGLKLNKLYKVLNKMFHIHRKD